MSLVLGLDVSTSCTGWCVTNHEGTLVDIGSIPLSKQKSVYKKAQEVAKTLCDIMISHEISDVYIEENLQSFRTGLSSAKTLMTLSRYNGIVSHECWLRTGIVPTYYNVNSARKTLGIDTTKKARKPNEKAKDVVHRWVKGHEIMKKFKWPTKTLKGGPRSGQTIEDPGCMDLSDAFVMSLCGQLEHF